METPQVVQLKAKVKRLGKNIANRAEVFENVKGNCRAYQGRIKDLEFQAERFDGVLQEKLEQRAADRENEPVVMGIDCGEGSASMWTLRQGDTILGTGKIEYGRELRMELATVKEKYETLRGFFVCGGPERTDELEKAVREARSLLETFLEGQPELRVFTRQWLEDYPRGNDK